MKTIIILFVIVWICFTNIRVSSQIPDYTLIVTNITLISPNSLYFDIYMVHINPQVIDSLNLISIVYNFSFNPLISNGGDLTYTRINTHLPGFVLPPAYNVIDNKLVCSGILPHTGFYTVSTINPGTLIARMRVQTSAPSFAQGQYIDLRWINPPSANYETKVIERDYGDITNPDHHYVPIIQSINSQNSPLSFNLQQNYPNPFNSSTVINYELLNSGFVKLKVFDVNGKETETLVNSKQNTGRHSVMWNANDRPSGIYYYRIEIENFFVTKQMLLLK